MIEYTAKRTLGISDFSIVIENMPTDFTKQDIQKSLQDYLRQKKEEDFDNEISLKELEVVSYNEGRPFYLDEKEFTD